MTINDRHQGMFDPEELKEMSDELHKGDTPGETIVERETRASKILHQKNALKPA